MFTYLNKRRQKGQSTLEYAILIIIIIGALLSIQVYIKRGIQGRLKSATDDIGEQFAPGNTNALKTVTTTARTRETFSGGVTSSVLSNREMTVTDSHSQIQNTIQPYWGN